MSFRLVLNLQFSCLRSPVLNSQACITASLQFILCRGFLKLQALLWLWPKMEFKVWLLKGQSELCIFLMKKHKHKEQHRNVWHLFQLNLPLLPSDLIYHSCVFLIPGNAFLLMFKNNLHLLLVTLLLQYIKYCK